MVRTQGYASQLGKAPTTLYYLKKLVVRWEKSPPHLQPGRLVFRCVEMIGREIATVSFGNLAKTGVGGE